MNTDGNYPRTSNFMEHGTLAGRIRQDDYRPFLLALYGNLCYAMDSGNRYAPEDALLPGNFPGEGSPYAWSAVVNSELQPTLGLRWLLCFEEHDCDVVHLQKAAPQHWFLSGEKIQVRNCPTRFGSINWSTQASEERWHVEVSFAKPFAADLLVHIHPPGRAALRSSTLGELHASHILIPSALLSSKTNITLDIT